jgi:hypothetical protein
MEDYYVPPYALIDDVSVDVMLILVGSEQIAVQQIYSGM